MLQLFDPLGQSGQSKCGHKYIQQIIATAIATTTRTTIALAMLEVQRTAAKQRKHIRNRPAAAAAGTEARVATEAVGQPGWPRQLGCDCWSGQTDRQTGRKKPSAGSWPSWWKQFCTRLQTKIAATQETDSKNLLLKSIKETEAGLLQLLLGSPSSLLIPLSCSSSSSCCCSAVFGQVCLRAFYTFLMQCGATATG